MIAIQATESLRIQRVDYPQLPDYSTLLKIARLYANAFADLPWNEFKVCDNAHYFGRQQSELMNCTICAQLLRIAYPEEETTEYIIKELKKSEASLVIFEDSSGSVLAAGWGYTCTTEELQDKYHSLQMKQQVVAKLKGIAERVCNIYYLSEIMVDASLRKRGLASKITQSLIDKAHTLNQPLVMRTRYDSPMVRIANNMQMSQVMISGEDYDNPSRVLYMKI